MLFNAVQVIAFGLNPVIIVLDSITVGHLRAGGRSASERCLERKHGFGRLLRFAVGTPKIAAYTY